MFLLSYKEFVDKYKIFIQLKVSTDVFNAAPKRVLILLPKSAGEDVGPVINTVSITS